MSKLNCGILLLASLILQLLSNPGWDNVFFYFSFNTFIPFGYSVREDYADTSHVFLQASIWSAASGLDHTNPSPPVPHQWIGVLVWALPGVGSWMRASWLSQLSFLSFNTHTTNWVGAPSLCLYPMGNLCWCGKSCPFEDSKHQWSLKC